MPETESFDAFYARTVWNVTSQMHALAGDDSAADHAIREAYAMAYQQWYQASRYPDPEAWVLSAAKEAYQRRRPNGPLAASAPAANDDNSTWPGIYRPAPAARPPAGAADGYRSSGRPGHAAAQPAGAPAGTPSDQAPSDNSPAPTWSAATASAGSGGPGAASPGQAGQPGGAPGWHSGGQATTALASPAPAGPTGPSRRLGRQEPGPIRSRRPLIAAVVAIVVIAVAVIGYEVASGGHKAPSAAGTQKTTTPAKPKPHMLGAGLTGRRSAIPWTLIGPGWTVAETSTAAPDSSGSATGSSEVTTYLVDPKGGKYLVSASTGTSTLQLVAWSGDAQYALYDSVSSGQVTPSYSLLSLRTGKLAALNLPANVNAVGFTRPDGLNILAVKQGPALFKLQRYSLTGTFQATIGQLARKPGTDWTPDVCGAGCSALSSPDGDTAVWGIVGDEMQLVSNAGGLIHKLHVPGSGTPPSCIPVSWWDADTVLANCGATSGSAPGATRLWLVPADGGTPTPVTPPSGGESGAGDVAGAWTANGTVYVTSTSGSQCPNAPSGPGGLGIIPASQAGANSSPMTIASTTGNHNGVVAAVGDRLLVLAQTSCPGTSSLLWYRPATGATQPLLTEPSGEVGVIAAVAFGLSPESTTSGLY